MARRSRGIARAIGYFDVSASTILWHEARSRDQGEEEGRCQETLAQALADFFSAAIQKAAECGVQFVNTTGDGFLAVSHSTYWSSQTGRHDDPNYHPAQAICAFTRNAHGAFAEHVRTFVETQRFVCRKSVHLRVALHYGSVHELNSGGRVHFFGDPLNYASRLLDSGVARRNQIACSQVFFARFHRREIKEVGPPAETMSDRNKYPEPVEVYDLHDIQAAGHRIERVREYQGFSKEDLKRVVFDAGRVGHVLVGASPVKGRSTPSSMSYTYLPKGGSEPTLVEFLIEPRYRSKGIAPGPGARLKVKQFGFASQPESVWRNELYEWDSRLATIGESLAPDRAPKRYREGQLEAG
jgi:class 3 adenylate cyclase